MCNFSLDRSCGFACSFAFRVFRLFLVDEKGCRGMENHRWTEIIITVTGTRLELDPVFLN